MAKKKSYFTIILASLILISCKKDSPSDISCESEIGNLLPVSHAYTGDKLLFYDLSLCTDDELVVTIDDIEIPILTSNNRPGIKIPASSTSSSVEMAVYINAELIEKKEIVLYPGEGIWKAIAPFPSDGRANATATSLSNMGFVIGGGNWDTGDEYNDLYMYDPLEDSWEYKLSDDEFDYTGSSYGFNNKLFLIRFFSDGVVTFDPETNDFQSVGTIRSLDSRTMAFTHNESIYTISGSDGFIFLYKFNDVLLDWELIENKNLNGVVNFTVYYDNAAWTGYHVRNENILHLIKYDFIEGEFVEMDISAGVEFHYDWWMLRHLFTINELAYFIEEASASSGLGAIATITGPQNKLYILNMKEGEWRTLEHSFPESFAKFASFEIDAKGYTGLSLLDNNTTSFAYSRNFYEFLPE
ncbi:MAG: hypothetical protein GY816_06210 [Cytophagales bacterium]|nr:hypothetical protein [Cytophagales bacterium]